VGVETVEVEEETQSHLINCPQYQHLRQGLDIYRMEDMVKYFQAVLSMPHLHSMSSCLISHPIPSVSSAFFASFVAFVCLFEKELF
jgi:hypothetical protein